MGIYQPSLPVERMQTYTIASPKQTHRRPATCEEVGCKDFLSGFIVRLARTDMDRITLMHHGSQGLVDGLKRHYVETTSVGDAERTFYFEAGTPCWNATKHTVSLDRPEFYLVRGGDQRANTGLIRRHTQPEHWVEDMQENFDKLRKVI
jgi:hypothetical protein